MPRHVTLILAGISLLLLASCKASPGQGSAAATSAALPSLIGEKLSKAEDQAQNAGFTHIASKDLHGDRMQILDGDWKVCTQNPAPGLAVTTAKILLGVVKNDETCPTLKRPGSPATPRAAGTPTPRSTASASPSATPRHTSTPRPAPTTQPPAVLLSPSGNYYRAGQYCPDADAGLTTMDADGNTLTCVMESGRYHWHA